MVHVLSGRVLDSALTRAGVSRIQALIEHWREGSARPEDLDSQVSEAIALEVSIAVPQPETALPPPNNRWPNAMLAIGVLLLIVAISWIADRQSWDVIPSKANHASWVSISAIAGLLLTIIGYRRRVSSYRFVLLAAAHEEHLTESWVNDTAAIASEALATYRRRLHQWLGKSLNIPARLFEGFVEASIRNHQRRINDWDVSWWINQPSYPPPPQNVIHGLSHQEYEQYCAQWMASFEWTDAQVTRFSRDGGIGVESTDWVVQCKHYSSGSIGVGPVREILGVGSHLSKRSALISTVRFSREALNFAKSAGVALLLLDETRGIPVPASPAAQALMAGPSEQRMA